MTFEVKMGTQVRDLVLLKSQRYGISLFKKNSLTFVPTYL